MRSQIDKKIMFFNSTNLQNSLVFARVFGPPAVGPEMLRIRSHAFFLEGPKMTILDRFLPSWLPPGKLLAMLRGAKMGPKSLPSGLEDGSPRGKAHLQFHREFSGSWRLGGGPSRSKIGLKRVRRGVRVHPFRHASFSSIEKCSSRN